MENPLILLVEDNPNDVELTLRAFKKTYPGYQVDVVTDGEMALEYIFHKGRYSDKSITSCPRLVLLDLKLPKVDGLEILRQIRSEDQTRRMTVVVLTTSLEERDLVRAYDLGANSYIRKPIDYREFTEAVHKLCDYWLVLNQKAPH